MIFSEIILNVASIAVCTIIIFVFGVLPVIIGTSFYRNGVHKKLGILIRIMGYIFFIPVMGTGVAVACYVHEILK